MIVGMGAAPELLALADGTWGVDATIGGEATLGGAGSGSRVLTSDGCGSVGGFAESGSCVCGGSTY